MPEASRPPTKRSLCQTRQNPKQSSTHRPSIKNEVQFVLPGSGANDFAEPIEINTNAVAQPFLNPETLENQVP
ncbi:hypothetical protein VHEMI05021 [[Torrubiella] hemipterigena]|uniref:Uncharacterized protein n=1 Tax=[Torrubiella] hemipterigena TaxID=1531966 RepID=A0A0A1SWY4_9HYPO|nr:hypothetical protein VHEMI05021 [[Torrubiella] hemipterigena]